MESKNSNSKLSSEQKIGKNVNREKANNYTAINWYGYFLYDKGKWLLSVHENNCFWTCSKVFSKKIN